MKKIILLLFLFIIPAFQTTSAEYFKYFPLKTGNVFVYKYTYTEYPIGTNINEKRTMKIVKDTIINNKKYYYVQGVFNRWLRLDSLDGNLYAYDSIGCRQYVNEILIDTLLLNENQYSSSCFFNNSLRCIDTSTASIFGVQTMLKQLYYSIGGGAFYYSTGRYYLEKFGLYSIGSSSGSTAYSASSNLTLIGCVIDNVSYGDTSLTNITINSMLVNDFKLHKNYPNPFNPVTNIKFQLPKSSFVNLQIYDLIGREVKTLLSENLNGGEYNVEWDASNFSSGVYFFVLRIDDFSQTRKMVLIK